MTSHLKLPCSIARRVQQAVEVECIVGGSLVGFKHNRMIDACRRFVQELCTAEPLNPQRKTSPPASSAGPSKQQGSGCAALNAVPKVGVPEALQGSAASICRGDVVEETHRICILVKYVNEDAVIVVHTRLCIPGDRLSPLSESPTRR